MKILKQYSPSLREAKFGNHYGQALLNFTLGLVQDWTPFNAIINHLLTIFEIDNILQYCPIKSAHYPHNDVEF